MSSIMKPATANALIRDKDIETCSFYRSQTRDKDALSDEGVARVIDLELSGI